MLKKIIDTIRFYVVLRKLNATFTANVVQKSKSYSLSINNMSWLKFARVLEIKCAVNTDNPLLKLNLQPLTQEVKQFLFLHGLPGVDVRWYINMSSTKMSEFDVLNCQTLEYQHVTHGTVIIVT
mgnify:CR=1 FL=1